MNNVNSFFTPLPPSHLSPLHRSEFRLRMDLELAVGMAGVAGAVPLVYKYIKSSEWPTIKDRYGGRVWREMSARPQDRIVA